MPIIEYDAECKSCKATGLYVGMAERDGAAVVCHVCNGTGKDHVRIEYTTFESRKRRKGVKRVYQSNPGICIGTKGKDITYNLEDFGGITPDEFYSTGKFPKNSENRMGTCPAWWYQSVDYKLKPMWDECCGCGSFSNCTYFATKGQCWSRFDLEHKPKKGAK